MEISYADSMLTIQSQLNGGMHATKSKAITNILRTMKFENETPITQLKGH